MKQTKRTGWNSPKMYKWEKERHNFPPRFPIRKWGQEKDKKYRAFIQVSLLDADDLDFNNLYVCEYYYFLKRDGDFSTCTN